MFQYVPQDILPRLVDLTPYTLVVLRKGENYHNDNAIEVIQSLHLPYLFRQRDEGILVLTFPIMDQTELAAIAIYNTQSKQEVSEWLEDDPAVKDGIFTYEVVAGLGLKGDMLP